MRHAFDRYIRCQSPLTHRLRLHFLSSEIFLPREFHPMPTLTTVLLILLAGGALTYVICDHAPEGYEDQGGFWEESDET